MGLISRVSSRTYRDLHNMAQNKDIMGLMTDPKFLQQVGLLRAAKDPEDTQLLKFATGINVASQIYSALTPANHAENKRAKAYLRIAERINQEKAKNNGLKPSDAVLERICREEFGC